MQVLARDHSSFHEALDYGTAKGSAAIAAGDFDGDSKADLAMTSRCFKSMSGLVGDINANEG